MDVKGFLVRIGRHDDHEVALFPNFKTLCSIDPLYELHIVQYLTFCNLQQMIKFPSVRNFHHSNGMSIQK